MTGLNIYQIISKIGEEAGALAPEKTGGVPFAFRGVDGTVAHLVPHLRKYGVITVPEVIDQRVTQREVGNNKTITQTEVLTRFHFYAPDGTSVTATTAGLAQDYSDRSTSQAQSVAFRIALLQTFTLPTHDKEPEVAGEETQKVIADNPKTKVDPNAPKIESRQDVKNRLISKSKNAKNNVKGREYLTMLVNSGGFDGRDFDSVWTTGTTEDLLKLEATFDVAEASK